ncbi:MAG: S1 RNA-binding domain-containing protein, partial [Ilumatobacter sp.]|nr:S1 RNA-binding domain-containing protein [Ilumatobacter sp.]
LAQAKEARLDILDVMLGAIAEPRDEVRDTAPKIISFEIPIDKIGEVIGPKGKVINSIQAETGAVISVDDDGMVGIVSIASPDKAIVLEAERQIGLILDPPTADVGATYQGRVVNITKFGAFVNILPGRDGLLHISKIGGSKRIDRVEDVLELGQEVEVIVEDVDPNGKISLKPVGDGPEATGGDAGSSGSSSSSSSRSSNEGNAAPAEAEAAGDRESVSFESAFDSELEGEFGDLGPDAPRRSGGGGGRGGRGGRGGGGGRR